MKKVVFIAIGIAVAVLIAFFIYQSESGKITFPEKLGDMTLAKSETGEEAAREISGMYGLRDVPLSKGYAAVYSGKKGTMRIWVAEAPDHNTGNDAYNAMNSMLGGSTGHEGHEYSGDVGQAESHKGHENSDNNNFDTPVKVDIIDFVKPDVYMLKVNNAYNYYYFKMDYRMGRVFWIMFDFHDPDYQISIVKQAVMNI